jgi:hypothetical protein
MVSASETLSVDGHQQPLCVELDQSLLTASKRQKFSSVKMRQGCRDSYRCFFQFECIEICVNVVDTGRLRWKWRQKMMWME